MTTKARPTGKQHETRLDQLLTVILLSSPLLLPAYASTSPPDPVSLQSCQSRANQGEQQTTKGDKNAKKCDELTLSNSEQQAEDGEQQALKSIERKLEEERLKVLFVDVNSVLETVGSTLDWTANWLDGYFAESEQHKNNAKTWGHIVMGWEPRDGEWGNFPIKFKVRAKLPNLENKVEIILSDNEQEDFNNLPYESARPEAYKSSQKSLGAAVRFMHRSSENVRASSRLGYGEGQLYARSSVTYRKKFFDNNVTLNLQPSLEYYYNDGWGARGLVDAGYRFNYDNEFRLNYSIRDLQSYRSPQWRTGAYHIAAVGESSALIIGALSVGDVEPNYAPDFHKFSVRYRRKAIRSWIFVEAEPFVSFSRTLEQDEITGQQGYSDFTRDIGITFRLEAHYGFL